MKRFHNALQGCRKLITCNWKLFTLEQNRTQTVVFWEIVPMEYHNKRFLKKTVKDHASQLNRPTISTGLQPFLNTIIIISTPTFSKNIHVTWIYWRNVQGTNWFAFIIPSSFWIELKSHRVWGYVVKCLIAFSKHFFMTTFIFIKLATDKKSVPSHRRIIICHNTCTFYSGGNVLLMIMGVQSNGIIVLVNVSWIWRYDMPHLHRAVLSYKLYEMSMSYKV